MKLEDQVCSLEYAKRLKELGIRDESHFSYYKSSIMKEYDLCTTMTARILNDKSNEIYPAFTVAELGEMLGTIFDSYKRDKYDWICRSFDLRANKTHHSFSEKESDARAKMLIYLIEIKIINVDNL